MLFLGSRYLFDYVSHNYYDSNLISKATHFKNARLLGALTIFNVIPKMFKINVFDKLNKKCLRSAHIASLVGNWKGRVGFFKALRGNRYLIEDAHLKNFSKRIQWNVKKFATTLRGSMVINKKLILALVCCEIVTLRIFCIKTGSAIN